LTFFVAFVTVVAAFMSYQSSNLDHDMESADRSYTQLMADAGNDSVRTRIGAIPRIASFLYRQVPASSDIGVLDTLRLTAGFHTSETALYHHDMQLLIRGLFSEIHAGNSTDPQRELDSLVDLLVKVGPEGWYYHRMNQRLEPREDGLKWVWNPPLTSSSAVGENEDISTVPFFRGLPLDGFNLSRFKLNSADFRGSRLTEANFSGADMKGANFTGTCAQGPNFDLSRLDKAIFSSASVYEGHFESSDLEGASADKAVFVDSHFEAADLDHIKMTGVRFSRSKLMGARITHATLQTDFFDDADFTSADLSDSDFDFSQFQHSMLRAALLVGASLRRANFSGADLSLADLDGADLSNADLREANLSGTKNLLKARSLAGANLMGVRGVPKVLLGRLLLAGAVLDKKPHAPIIVPTYLCMATAPPYKGKESLDNFSKQKTGPTQGGSHTDVDSIAASKTKF
jgi:uncharacterized protein YjbI with pentapeptide repeats